MIPLDKSKRMVEVETNATNKDEPLRSHPNMEHLDIMTRDENPNLNEWGVLQMEVSFVEDCDRVLKEWACENHGIYPRYVKRLVHNSSSNNKFIEGIWIWLDPMKTYKNLRK